MSSQNVPELRLDGFEGEWAMVKLGSIAHMYQPHTISGEELQPSGIPVFGANGFIGFYHSANHQNDQVTISARGDAGTPSYVPGPVWITGNSMVVNVDHADIDKRFLYADLGAMSLKKFVTGGAQPQLTREVLNEVEVPTPPTVEEQRAIGAVFAKLDTTIASHKKKLDLLKQTKTSLLQRMFPQDGAAVPELRLEGFEGEWEISTLGHEVQLINGRAYSQPELLETGKYPVLRVGNFYTNTSWYYSDLELGEKYYADNGDLLYTWSASFGPHVWNGGKVIYHYHIWKIELGQRLNRDFLLQLLENDKGAILAGQSGSTMVHVTKEGMEARTICFPPTLDEQQAIGALFGKLDTLISAEAQYIDKLTQTKTALLQKMFV